MGKKITLGVLVVFSLVLAMVIFKARYIQGQNQMMLNEILMMQEEEKMKQEQPAAEVPAAEAKPVGTTEKKAAPAPVKTK